MNKIRELLDGHIVDYTESDMTTVTVDKSKRVINSKKYLFPEKCLCGYKTHKEINIITKKEDAVRRCSRGYDCDYTAKEKLKHIELRT